MSHIVSPSGMWRSPPSEELYAPALLAIQLKIIYKVYIIPTHGEQDILDLKNNYIKNS